jgi:hypothetical protein
MWVVSFTLRLLCRGSLRIVGWVGTIRSLDSAVKRKISAPGRNWTKILWRPARSIGTIQSPHASKLNSVQFKIICGTYLKIPYQQMKWYPLHGSVTVQAVRRILNTYLYETLGGTSVSHGPVRSEWHSNVRTWCHQHSYKVALARGEDYVHNLNSSLPNLQLLGL